jgi:hypothetical protein
VNLMFIKVSPPCIQVDTAETCIQLNCFHYIVNMVCHCVPSLTVGKCKLINTLHTLKQPTRTQHKSIILSIKTDSPYVLILQPAHTRMSVYLPYSNEISDKFTVNCSNISCSRYLQPIGNLTRCSTRTFNIAKTKVSQWTRS